MNSKMQENILGDVNKEKEAFGHVTLGKKLNGKEFLAKYAYNEGDYLVFVTKMGQVIKNRRDLIESLKVVV
jgi:hypothetical protein